MTNNEYNRMEEFTEELVKQGNSSLYEQIYQAGGARRNKAAMLMSLPKITLENEFAIFFLFSPKHFATRTLGGFLARTATAVRTDALRHSPKKRRDVFTENSPRKLREYQPRPPAPAPAATSTDIRRISI